MTNFGTLHQFGYQCSIVLLRIQFSRKILNFSRSNSPSLTLLSKFCDKTCLVVSIFLRSSRIHFLENVKILSSFSGRVLISPSLTLLSMFRDKLRYFSWLVHSSRFSSSSATLAEMRLNRTLMERSIPIQLISATLAEMRLKRKLVEKIN